eukprot:TRINITY_DN799_c0_g1_i2.p1 TRINITY_DN799_c0_g1~~TRINITY_DN799_c0_g1_i2.p1  ORF type:complete len:367 (+),score=115.14 TRINITY_DN799_c0_g1_i2:69-1103(+)
MPELLLYWRCRDGAQEPVEVDSEATVGDLEARIQAAGGFAAPVSVSFAAQRLSDKLATLADLGICPQSLVTVTQQTGFQPTVHAGDSAVTAIMEDGSVHIFCERKHEKVPGLEAVNVVALTGCADRVLALLDSGAVLSFEPHGVQDLGYSNVVQVTSARSFHVVLMEDGTVQTDGPDVPQGVQGRVKQVSARSEHVLAILDDGSVVGWGANHSQECDPPQLKADAVCVAAGCDHSIAVLSDGSVLGWGLFGGFAGVDEICEEGVPIVGATGSVWGGLLLRADQQLRQVGDSRRSSLPLPFQSAPVVAASLRQRMGVAVTTDGDFLVFGEPLPKVPDFGGLKARR